MPRDHQPEPDIKRTLNQIDTKSVVIYVSGGLSLWGIPQLEDSSNQLKLISGDHKITVPKDDILGIVPWPDNPQTESVYDQLTGETVSAVENLEYPHVERSVPFAEEPGYGAIEVESETADRGAIELTENQIFYVDAEYIRNRRAKWTWTFDLRLVVLGIGLDKRNPPVDKWKGYLTGPSPTPHEEAIDKEEPVIEGYVERAEVNGEVVTEFDDEWVAGIITTDQIADDGEHPEGDWILAYFKNNGFATDNQILEDISQKVTLRGDIQTQKMSYNGLEADQYMMVRSAAYID